MKAQIQSPKKLVDAISIISELVTEVRLKFLEEGLSIVAVDPANVAMIIFKMPKETFSVYESSNDTLGVNLDDFKKILRRASSAKTLDFESDESQLTISILDKTKRTFTLSLIDTTTEEKEEPKLDFSTEVELDSADFVQTMEDCSVVADSCTLSSEAENFSISASGSINSAKNEFSKDLIKLSGEGRAKYSIEYLMKFSKAAKLSQKAVLKFSNNYPLRLEFAGDELGIAFVLAPRVEND